MPANKIEDASFFKELKKKEEKYIEQLRKRNLSYEELLQVAAAFLVSALEEQALVDELHSDLEQCGLALHCFSSQIKDNAGNLNLALIEMLSESKNLAAKSLLKGVELQKKALARKGAKAKLFNDPKQQEKTFVLECWLAWQQNPDSYPSQAAFARDMLEKCEALVSQPKIEAWCREWKKSLPTH